MSQNLQWHAKAGTKCYRKPAQHVRAQDKTSLNLFKNRYYFLDPYKNFHPFEFRVLASVRVRVRVLMPVLVYTTVVWYILWSYYLWWLLRRYASAV